MKHLLAGALILAASTGARADTAVKELSCVDAMTAISWYDTCVWMNGGDPSACTPPAASRCWDFEDDTGIAFGSWTMTGAAFATQPTKGDNVAAWRVLQTQTSPLHPTSGTVLDDLYGIGGDYWNTPYPIGNQGEAWLGTYENHPTQDQAWGATQGDGVTGMAVSPSFVVDRNVVSFLIGGGCDINTVYVELQVFEPQTRFCAYRRFGSPVCFTVPARWTRAFGNGEAKVRTGRCVEPLHREGFFTDAGSGLQGRTVRVAVVDNATGSWGHINVDHVVHTNDWPTDFNYANQPLWGFADTHAHLGNHQAMKSLDTTNLDGYLFHGAPGTITTDHGVLSTELGSCDHQGHGTAHAARKVIASFEAASLGSSPNYPKDCNPAQFFGSCLYLGKTVALQTPIDQQHFGGGVSATGGADLNGWPYWNTRAHQQMHLTWVQRAYRGGQRLMFASAGNTEVLGMAMRGSHMGDYLSDYGALRRFKNYMFALAAANPTWMEIALSPADARRIIKSNKLAIVLATEVDDLGSKCSGDLTSTAADDPLDHGKTTTSEGVDPWNQERDRTHAASCTTAAQWTTRIDNLYRAGYRVVMPVHLADNALGGTAIYDEKFNINSRFMTGSFISVLLSPDVQYVYPSQPLYSNWSGWWKGTQAGWTNAFGIIGGQSVMYSVAEYGGSPVPYPYVAGQGHINAKQLTGDGMTVIAAIRARGMILDLAHMGQLGRERVLGLGANQTTSPLNNGCDMSTWSCQSAAYPAISSHAGLREMSTAADYMGGGPNEGGLRADMIDRIRTIGGTVGIGTTAADVKSANEAATGSWTGIKSQTVANSCGGSSRTFAQSYIYALRKMNGKGITLGTDINGLEDRLNPRFGTQGCYARGNIPNAKQLAADGTSLVDTTSQVPINYRPSILGQADGTAGLQRYNERQSSSGLNYAHYAGTPPHNGRYWTLFDPPSYRMLMASAQFNISSFGTYQSYSMNALSGLPAMNASVTGNRTFDLNYDGLAHYGMLPDLLQDTRVVGMTSEQLGPLFQGAEAVVQTWEKGCRLSDPTVNALGCN
jgi:microsomal dipeptidase-like Zn-dependent dipeptidase